MALNFIVTSFPLVIPIIILIISGLFIGLFTALFNPPEVELIMPEGLPLGLDFGSIVAWVMGIASSGTPPPSILDWSVLIVGELAFLCGWWMLGGQPGGGWDEILSVFAWLFTFAAFIFSGAAIMTNRFESPLEPVFGIVGAIFSALAMVCALLVIPFKLQEVKLADMGGDIALSIVSILLFLTSIHIVQSY